LINTNITPKVDLPISKNHVSPILFIKIVILICGIAIVNIWPIENSIAARNIVLALGSTLSLVLIIRSFKTIPITRLLSLYLLLGLVCWVLILYFIKPTAASVQWQEITSTWLRVVLALLLGTGLGLTISESKILRNLALFGFLPLLAIQAGIYLYQCYALAGIAAPYTPGIFITKAGGTYFLMWPFLLLCAYINYLFSTIISTSQQSIIKLKLGFCLLIFTICYLAFFSLNSMNGILIASICTFILAVKITLKVFLRGGYLGLGATIFTTLIVISAFSIYTYSKYDGNKFNRLLQDFQIGTQIDRYTNWRNDTPQWVPDIPNSPPVNHSTYYRVASFINGTRLISEYPLGTGFTYLPYKYFMSKNYPGSAATHTHSGWIDFTLGVGIPGLVLCWLAIALAIWLAIKKHWRERQIGAPLSLWSYIVVWGLGGISILWVVAEVSEKEYIEHLMFMIAFLAAGNTPLPANKEKISSFNP